MMNKALVDYIEQELRNYRTTKAILQSMMLENDIGIQAQTLSETPRSVTNKFSSSTENEALNSKVNQLQKETKRVEIWLDALDDTERYVVEGIYIHCRSYNTITQRWSAMGNYVLSRSAWTRKRRQAIKKICEICLITLQKCKA